MRLLCALLLGTSLLASTAGAAATDIPDGYPADYSKIVEAASGRLLGTSQFYRSAPCIHGLELGYILHDPADRGRGLASEAVKRLPNRAARSALSALTRARGRR